MKPTLKDIAEQSGYSVTTVSRALGGHSDVNQATRERILEIARSLNYEPNSIARQLQGKRTSTIGIIRPANLRRSEDDFFSLLVKGAGYAAALHHYDLLISAVTESSDEMSAYRRIVGGRRVDGVILARNYHDDPRIAYLQQSDWPFVVSGRGAPDQPSDFPYIDVDSQLGIRMMVNHLVSGGHRRIALILPPPELAYTEYRHAGYQQGLQEARITYQSDRIIHADLTQNGGYQAAVALLDRLPDMDAIVACNDLMAIGAMSALRERGVEPGTDIAVGGFDDIPAAAYTNPTLTTIRQPIFEIGEQLANMLIAIIAGDTEAAQHILLEPQLIVRASTSITRNRGTN